MNWDCRPRLIRQAIARPVSEAGSSGPDEGGDRWPYICLPGPEGTPRPDRAVLCSPGLAPEYNCISSNLCLNIAAQFGHPRKKKSIKNINGQAGDEMNCSLLVSFFSSSFLLREIVLSYVKRGFQQLKQLTTLRGNFQETILPASISDIRYKLLCFHQDLVERISNKGGSFLETRARLEQLTWTLD